MICYKDKTFCDGGNPKCSHFKKCHRAFKEEDKRGAEKWWSGCKGSPPVAFFTEPEKLPCYNTGEDIP